MRPRTSATAINGPQLTMSLRAVSVTLCAGDVSTVDACMIGAAATRRNLNPACRKCLHYVTMWQQTPCKPTPTYPHAFPAIHIYYVWLVTWPMYICNVAGSSTAIDDRQPIDATQPEAGEKPAHPYQWCTTCARKVVACVNDAGRRKPKRRRSSTLLL